MRTENQSDAIKSKTGVFALNRTVNIKTSSESSKDNINTTTATDVICLICVKLTQTFQRTL